MIGWQKLHLKYSSAEWMRRQPVTSSVRFWFSFETIRLKSRHRNWQRMRWACLRERKKGMERVREISREREKSIDTWEQKREKVVVAKERQTQVEALSLYTLSPSLAAFSQNGPGRKRIFRPKRANLLGGMPHTTHDKIRREREKRAHF